MSVTLMVNVWAAWLVAPESGVVATKTYGQFELDPETKSLQEFINEVFWENTLKVHDINTDNNKSALIFFMIWS